MKILKDLGLKTTKTRINIIELLENDCLLSAEQISHKLKEERIKLSSIYRNLAIFEEEGLLIKTIGLDGISYYQLNNKKHKHQLVCINCGKSVVIDDCPLHNIKEKLEENTGFKIKSHNFEFSGLCEDCK